MAACSWAAISAPRASAWRSTALVVTGNPASSSQLFPPLLKGGLAAHHRHHPPHPRRIFRAFHIQLLIARTLPLVAGRADIVGTLRLHPPQHGEQLLGTALVVVRRPAAATRNLPRILVRGGQQLLQHRRPRPVQGRARGHLHGFQIQPAGLASSGQDDRQQRLYFLRHFPLNGLRRFFSCSAPSVSGGKGRWRQIFSFTSRKARLSC